MIGKMATIIQPKNIDCGKKGILKFSAGQKVTIIKTINEFQVIIQNEIGETCSYLISQLKII